VRGLDNEPADVVGLLPEQRPQPALQRRQRRRELRQQPLQRRRIGEADACALQLAAHCRGVGPSNTCSRSSNSTCELVCDFGIQR